MGICAVRPRRWHWTSDAALTRYFYSNVDAMVEGKFSTGSVNAKAVDIDDPAIDGKCVYATPHFTATGRVEYNPSYMPEFTLAYGGKYVGNMPVDAANTQFTRAYVLYDLRGKYETRIGGKDVTFRAGINNLFNRRYWTSAYGYFVLPGAT